MTFAEYVDYFRANILPLHKPATRSSASSRLNTLVAEFGQDDIEKLDPRRIQEFFSRLAKTLKPSSVKAMWRVFYSVLSRAEAEGMAVQIRKPKLPKLERVQQGWLTLDQMHMLFKVCWGPELIFFQFMCETGLRIGEAMAVQYLDINLDAKTMNISKSYAAVKDGGIQAPKTSASKRVLSISTPLAHAICNFRPEDAADDFYVFGKEGRPGSYSSWLANLKDKLRVLGLKKEGYGHHILRRTNATIMAVNLGISEVVSAYRLGHENAGITLGIYAQKWAGMDREAALLLGKVIFGKDSQA